MATRTPLLAPLSETQAVTPPSCDRLWRVDDVAAFLGVPVQTLYTWRLTGDGPPAFKLGKHLRFDPDAVRAWVLGKAG